MLNAMCISFVFCLFFSAGGVFLRWMWRKVSPCSLLFNWIYVVFGGTAINAMVIFGGHDLGFPVWIIALPLLMFFSDSFGADAADTDSPQAIVAVGIISFLVCLFILYTSPCFIEDITLRYGMKFHFSFLILLAVLLAYTCFSAYCVKLGISYINK